MLAQEQGQTVRSRWNLATVLMLMPTSKLVRHSGRLTPCYKVGQATVSHPPGGRGSRGRRQTPIKMSTSDSDQRVR